MDLRRRATLDAKRIDTSTGEFEMVMATEGEASDGHIIRVAGIEHASEIPLQVDHGQGVLANVGTVREMRVSDVDGLPALRGIGRIRLTGDGPALAARRDLVDGIATGDIKAVSLRASGIPGALKERRRLPKDHPARVERSDPNPRKRHGLLFERSMAEEQSIVAMGADREALIGRIARAEDDETRGMWQNLVDGLDDAPRSRESEIIEALELEVSELEERLAREAASVASDSLPDPVPTMDVLLQRLEGSLKDLEARRTQAFESRLEDVVLRLTGRSLTDVRSHRDPAG